MFKESDLIRDDDNIGHLYLDNSDILACTFLYSNETSYLIWLQSAKRSLSKRRLKILRYTELRQRQPVMK